MTQDKIRELLRKVAAEYTVDHLPGLIADDILTTLTSAGLTIVPREPTEAMTLQGSLALLDIVLVGPPLIGRAYRAMIAAAGDANSKE